MFTDGFDPGHQSAGTCEAELFVQGLIVFGQKLFDSRLCVLFWVNCGFTCKDGSDVGLVDSCPPALRELAGRIGTMTKYSEELKKDAVALVQQGSTQSQICRDLGTSKSALSKWVTDADRAERGLPASAEVSREEDAQIRELIKRNRLLEQENEVLRRAAAYLSQIHITPQNDVPARPRNGRDRCPSSNACRGGVQGTRILKTGVLPVDETTRIETRN